MKNIGNPNGIIDVMKRAAAGEDVTIGFLGGSITQGAVVSDEALCYAARVFAWWKKTFPGAGVKYVNAGIGATTSQFGVARADDDLLKYEPDFIIVEYSVNDNDEKPYERGEFFRETYEGLIRKLLSYRSSKGYSPALLIVHSVRYDDGGNMEDVHSEIGRYYGIPCISMKELIYDKVMRGETDYCFEDITGDMLHPNDRGHGIVAGHITDYLESIRKLVRTGETGADGNGTKSDRVCSIAYGSGVTENCYQNIYRYNAFNSKPVMNGFFADDSPVMEPFVIDTGIVGDSPVIQPFVTDAGMAGSTDTYVDMVLGSEVRDVFKNGWKARETGATISFEFTGGELAVMYRKSVKKPAPVAYAVIDGDEEQRIELNANFDEDWGDKAYMTTLIHHGIVNGAVKLKEMDKHTLVITIGQSEGCVTDFYLINILCRL
ncbi:MAG: SGNH/GDSL hydrolase family protein [Lachnospiraceae bacterium]|nr:SGNH/GDSL hydrolase family protein [Lachnospiraceae bacterium]